jgi:SAM-dependent methyltransferase
MSGFSADWLGLREPVDHRSRATGLAGQVQAAFAGRDQIRVVDLGCGTGSNLRATSLLLPPRQSWTLADYDPALLAAARERLGQWADHSEASPGGGDGLILHKGARRIVVQFAHVDLNEELDRALTPDAAQPVDLITASAFFDLCSATFIANFAAAVAKRRAAFYTMLTYNGEQRWTPVHPADADMQAAFHAHQATDKGFGAAAGPHAPKALASAFRDQGYAVTEGDSPWVLGAPNQRLITDLANGFAGAVAQTSGVPAGDLTSWRQVARTGSIVGHTDTFAQPR